MNTVSEIKLSYNRIALNNNSKLTSSEEINKFIKNYLELVKEDISLQEKFFALFFDVSMVCIGVLKVAESGIDCVLVDNRLIYSTAVTTGSKSVILVHNHPSGNMRPSAADRNITDKIKAGLKTLDINLLDHLIISPANSDYYSFADNSEI